jgi:hypothetical protein
MTSHSWLFANDVPSHPVSNLSIQRRSDEIAAEMFAQTEKRRLALEQLKSTLYTPADRISAWEKLYGLQLPFDSSHPILASIARATGLTLAEVGDEQKSRNEQAGRRAPAPSAYG